jgi:hypothetical protein
MSIRNENIIDRMERNGDYSAAQEFKESLREHNHSEYDRADRFNPADGAQYSYAGDCAERAYEDLRRDERRAEERQEEERQQEEDYYRHQQQQQEEQQEF